MNNIAKTFLMIVGLLLHMPNTRYHPMAANTK